MKINNNFWNWFGDSKTIKDDIPIKYYHGTDKKFTRVDKNKINKSGRHGVGFYFYNNEIAYEYYRNVLEVLLRIENPFNMYELIDLEKAKYLITSDIYEKNKPIIDDLFEYGGYCLDIYQYLTNDRLIELGYDGIIHGDVAVVFMSNQIKHVKNKGEWDINNDDIYL